MFGYRQDEDRQEVGHDTIFKRLIIFKIKALVLTSIETLLQSMCQSVKMICFSCVYIHIYCFLGHDTPRETSSVMVPVGTDRVCAL